MKPGNPLGSAGGVIDALTVEMLFDAIGVRLDGEALAGVRLSINWRFTDIGEDHVLGLANSALHHVAGRHDPDAAVTLTMPKSLLAQVMLGRTDLTAAVADGTITIDGDADALTTLFGAIEQPAGNFNIVTP